MINIRAKAAEKAFDKKAKNLKKSLFLPFGVDLDFFYPREKNNHFNFDCAFIGNDIKGTESTMGYLFPATEFNFGLFGNWQIERHKYKIWKNLKKLPPYKKVFQRRCGLCRSIYIGRYYL